MTVAYKPERIFRQKKTFFDMKIVFGSSGTIFEKLLAVYFVQVHFLKMFSKWTLGKFLPVIY